MNKPVESNEILRKQIFDIIDNQIRLKNPPETSQTLERLIGLGFTRLEAKQMIGQCIAVELFYVLKQQQPFNNDRYLKNLKSLPKEPFDE
jgi:hypothetical protein